MCVSDRVMKDVRALYDPCNCTMVEDEEVVIYPPDMREVQSAISPSDRSRIGITKVSNAVTSLVTSRKVWQELGDVEEHSRLHQALMSFIGSS